MKPMELRRHNEIIAFKAGDDSITAYHAYNLEVAEISTESFAQMTPIELTNGAIPVVKLPVNPEEKEAFEALNEWNSEINPDAKDGKIDFGIRSITLNINQVCNLKCLYCAAGGDGTYGEPTTQISIEKTLPQLKFFLEKLKPGQKFTISFVGGEPLLHPEAIHVLYNYVVAESAKLDLVPLMQVVTNGTLLKGKALDIIRSMKIQLIVSIDGTKEYNDKARPAKNGESSTDLTLAGIRAIMENRGDVTSIVFSAVYSSKSPNLLDTYRFFKTLNPDFIDFAFENAEPSIELQDKFNNEMNMVAAEAFQSGGENELRKIRKFDYYFNLLDRQQRVENHCGAGKSYLTIDAKNKIYSCVWETGKKDEVVGQNEQLHDVELAKYSKSLIELNNCQTCWARNLCGGGCMAINKAHNGDKHKKDKMFCVRIRSLLLTTIMYYKISRATAN